MSTKTPTKREAYATRMKLQQDELNAKIDELEAKTAQAEADSAGESRIWRVADGLGAAAATSRGAWCRPARGHKPEHDLPDSIRGQHPPQTIAAAARVGSDR